MLSHRKTIGTYSGAIAAMFSLLSYCGGLVISKISVDFVLKKVEVENNLTFLT